jgi:hypothetical protein
MNMNKPVSLNPKSKVSNVEGITSPATPRAPNPLKRKFDIDTAKIEAVKIDVTPSATIPTTSLQTESVVPPFNVKRMTEKGWTADRTPFKRLRALKLLRDLSEKYRVLVSLTRTDQFQNQLTRGVQSSGRGQMRSWLQGTLLFVHCVY